MRFFKDVAFNFTHPVRLRTRLRRIYLPGQLNNEVPLRRETNSGKPEFREMYIRALFLVLFLSSSALIYAQDFSQTINRSAQFENPNSPENELRVYNINGSVTVEGYTGSEIQISAIQEIDGTAREVGLAKEELSFRIEQEGNLVLIYIDAPFITLKRKGDRIHYQINRWNGWDNDYEFLFDITVRVPEKTHVYASTINQGKVTIENTRLSVKASNVNGELQLTDISGPTRAHTVNGDITATYSQSPDEDSDYQTVNGTIEVNYPDDLSADIQFKSLHGDLYTDFQNIERLQAQVKRDTKTRRGKTTYRLDRFAPIRIGEGGPTFSFEVLNGDVYVKRIKS